jgi:sucrose phosphorylase
MPDSVHLITYPDRLAGDVPGLCDLLDGSLHAVFGGVHLLPFFAYIDRADAGFDPIDHRKVDPRIGSWDDVARLARRADLCCDLIVNHVSIDSPWVCDVLARGDQSPHANMLLTYDAVFPDGAREEELLAIYRPRPGFPFTKTSVGGRPKLLWTTFTSSQIDVDIHFPGTWEYLNEVMRTMARHGVRTIRLDAVGYVAKTPGTSCFLTDEAMTVVDHLGDEAHRLGLGTLAEIHASQDRVLRVADHVDHIYDFALPPLVLHALHTGDVDPLLSWLGNRPDNCVNVLDTHDGIGVIDVGADHTDPQSRGLLRPEQIDALVESIHAASGGISRRATGAAASNLDLYQVNCTWYDAIGHDDMRLCISRLIQLLVPGVPHVYYVGLLAGRGDLALLERTGTGRDVNRHFYHPNELEAALCSPVVRANLFLIRLRNTHPAFSGTAEHAPGPTPGSLQLRWQNGDHRVEMVADPGQSVFSLTWSTPAGDRHADTVAELAAAQAVPGPDPLADQLTSPSH